MRTASTANRGSTMRLDSARELKLTLIEHLLALEAGRALPRAAAAALTALNLMCDAGRQASFALGISRQTSRAHDFRLAIRVQQRPLESSPIVDMLRKRARGEADIRYIGRVRPGANDPIRGGSAWPRHRQRPLLLGTSIGHPATTAGTLGCFVRDVGRAGRTGGAGGRRGRLGILSNNHVLALENAAKLRDPIIQPGVVDGGRVSRDTVAHLERFIRLRPGKTNRIDAAFALLDPKIPNDPTTLRGLGKLTGLAPALDIGDEVTKLGRTTGLTRGRISAIEVDNVFVDYGLGRVRFDDQIEIEGVTRRGTRSGSRPFSLGGDSGSLILNTHLQAAALLFAGSDHGGAGDHGLTYATPIAPVLKALRVTLEF
jgi:hypothetical protein